MVCIYIYTCIYTMQLRRAIGSVSRYFRAPALLGLPASQEPSVQAMIPSTGPIDFLRYRLASVGEHWSHKPLESREGSQGNLVRAIGNPIWAIGIY